MIILEIIGGFIFFGFVSLLSLLIIPSMFGCLGFVLFWACFVAVFMLFSISLKWIGICAIVFYAWMLIRKWIRYKKLPNYDEYLTINQNSYRDGHVVCNHCGSQHILNQGLFTRGGKLRYYLCLKCGSWLYRFKVL